MIYAELAGGLGNQMFIYAFARALGLRCGEPVTLLDRQDWRDDQGYAFFLHRNDDGALVGGMTLTNVRRGVAQTVSLGYWMGQRFAGKGYMSAAVRTIIPYAFGALGLRRVEAACVPHNAASVGLLERVGFSREGVARQYLCINGTWMDHALYAFVQGDRLG